VGYGLLWLCSPARAMVFCGSAAQRGLWPPVALQPSAGYGLLWLCSPARSMASCGSAAQRGLWPPRPRGFLITHNDAPQSVELLWTSDHLVAETSTLQHTQQTNIHAPVGIRTQDRSRRAAADLHLRPRGHWDRHIMVVAIRNLQVEYGHCTVKQTHGSVLNKFVMVSTGL
jgi:hypothetical protein